MSMYPEPQSGNRCWPDKQSYGIQEADNFKPNFFFQIISNIIPMNSEVLFYIFLSSPYYLGESVFLNLISEIYKLFWDHLA